MESIKNSAAELNGNQRTWRSCREVAEDGGGSRGNGEKGWKEEKMSQGRKAAGLRVARGCKEEGQERSYATLFWESGRWTGLLVNYEMKDHCSCCWVDQGRETLNKD